MPLSPEEELELEQIEAKLLEVETDPEQSVQSGLTPDEEDELTSIGEQLQRLDAPSTLDAGARGLAQGATLGFADEISGAVESALTDKSYEAARDESRAAFDKAKQAHGAAFFGGELVGGLASGIATGGAGAGMRGAAILGGLYSAGVSNRTGADLAKDTVIGVALGAAGEKVLRGIGRYAKKLFKKSTPEAQAVAEALSNSTDDIAVSLETNWLKLAYSKGANNADEVLTDPAWFRTVQGHVNKVPDSINKIVRKAKDSMTHKFNKISLANQGVSDDLVNSKVFNDLINESKKELVGTSDASKWIKTFQDDLTSGRLVGDISDGVSFEQLSKIKKHISGVLFRNKSAGQGIGEAAFNDRFGNKLLTNFSNSIDDRLAELDVTGTFKDVNRQFHLLKTAEKVIPSGGEKANASEISSFFNNLGSSKGVNKGSIFFENLEQFDVINGTSYAQQVIQEAKPVVDNFVLTNMAQFKNNMDQATSLIFRGRAIASISPVLTPLAAGEPVIVRLANKAGRISTKVAEAFRIPRNIQSIIENAPFVSKKLSTIEPSAAIAFNKAYEAFTDSGDPSEIEAMSKQALQAMPEVFEDGFGFNNKAVTEEEMIQARSQIMGSSLPLMEKIQAVSALAADGTVPTEEQMAPRITGPTQQQSERQLSLENLERVQALEKEVE